MTTKQYILLSIGLLLTACSDNAPESPAVDDAPVAISYTAEGYTGSRAAGEHYCDADLNEGKITKLDLLLVDASNSIIGRYSKNEDGTANRCDGSEHLLEHFDEKYPQFSRSKIEAKDNRLLLIANLDADLTSCTNLSDISKLSGLVHNAQQEKFVMTGELKAADVPATGNITIELRRVAAKIRIRLYEPMKAEVDGVTVTRPGTQITDFQCALCHYAKESSLFGEETKTLTQAGETATVPVFGPTQQWGDILTPDAEITMPDDADDLKKENARIYYSYPTDWYDYITAAIGVCGETDKTHKTNWHKDGTQNYTIRNYDDNEPIIADRQVYAIVYATYSGDGKQYYYKVPVNYRLSTLNDRICFTEDELDEVMSLYRLDRNHYYDVAAIIDRPGAQTPAAAALNPYFTATIADLHDGGTFDYIYE